MVCELLGETRFFILVHSPHPVLLIKIHWGGHTGLHGDSVSALWDTVIPHHEVKQNPGWAQPRHLCLTFLFCGRNLCPQPAGPEWKAGVGASYPHSASCPEGPADPSGTLPFREGRTGGASGAHCVCPDSGFVPWDLTERLFVSLWKQPQTKSHQVGVAQSYIHRLQQ